MAGPTRKGGQRLDYYNFFNNGNQLVKKNVSKKASKKHQTIIVSTITQTAEYIQYLTSGPFQYLTE